MASRNTQRFCIGPTVYKWTDGDASGHPCTRCGRIAAVVVDSRTLRDGSAAVVRRRRSCQECGHRWTTHELTAEQIDQIAAIPDMNKRLARELRDIAAALESDE